MEWEAFLPRVLPWVKSCPDSTALEHIKEAAREFCAGTLVWSYETDPIPTQAGASRYVAQIGDGQEIVRVDSIDVGGCEYPVINGPRARRLSRAGSGQRSAHMNFVTREFTLTPAPGADRANIIMDVAVEPTLDSTDFPDDLTRYVKDIARGAIASLCAMPECDWTNGPVASLNQTQFDARISEVRYEVERGFSRASRPVRSVWF